MKDMLSILKENPKFFEDLLNNKERIKEIQNALLKENLDLNEKIIKAIIKAMQYSTENESNPTSMDEKELENTCGGISIPKLAIDLVIATVCSYTGAKVSSTAAEQILDRGYTPGRKPSPGLSPDELQRYTGFQDGFFVGKIGASVGTMAAFVVYPIISDKIYNFLQKHGVEIS